jgi:hypothetical protein
LWYWVNAPLSLDSSMAECFLALARFFSNVSARSTLPPIPYSISDFCWDLSMTSCRRQQLLLGNSFCWNSITQGYNHVPSSIARHAESIPSCKIPLLG